MAHTKTTLALIILDGWGYREETTNKAIALANTPVLDDLFADRPSTLISGSGIDVGLPDGQMGNSEVGHVNLGAGRVVYQDFSKITQAISDGKEDEYPGEKRILIPSPDVATYDLQPEMNSEKLTDELVAPTMLHLMGMQQPAEMTGKTIMTLKTS